jgi:hypothetical protein
MRKCDELIVLRSENARLRAELSAVRELLEYAYRNVDSVTAKKVKTYLATVSAVNHATGGHHAKD